MTATVLPFPLLHPFDLSEQDTRAADVHLHTWRLTKCAEAFRDATRERVLQIIEQWGREYA